MSAQYSSHSRASTNLAQIFSCVFIFHLIVLSLVWVGFSAPNPRLPATFIYAGAMPAEDTGSGTEMSADQFTIDHVKSPDLNQWTKLRELSKQ